MAGIFKNGIWSCGLDFLPNGTVTAGGVFDFVTASGLSVNTTFSRFGTGKGIQCNDVPSAITRSFGVTLPTVVVGFAYNATALPASIPNVFASFYDIVGTSTLMSLTTNPAGQLQFYQNGGLSPTGGVSVSTPIGPLSAAGTIIANAYNFIEIMFTNSTTVGILQARVNGTQVISFAGNTSKGGSNTSFILGSKQSLINNNFDDIYILDTTGAAPNNTFLGNGKILTRVPTGDSATPGLNQWAFTTPAGSDFANAANIPANAAQNNTGSSVGQRMMFSFAPITQNRCNFLNTWLSAEENTAGACGITPVFRNNNVDQSTTEISMPGSFTYFNQNSVIDPNTGQPWFSGTGAAAGLAEVGVTRTT